MREYAQETTPTGAKASDEPMTGARRVELHRFKTPEPVTDLVAEEVPVALVYNGLSHVVMMASPMDLEAFALGFTLAERIVPDASHVYGIEVREGCHGGFEVALDISSECFWKLKKRRRAMEGRTGCGICGVESLQEAVRPVPTLEVTQSFDMRFYERALGYLQQVQTLGAATGCTHAAVWVNPNGTLAGGAEDVGRHVALDKLLGLRARGGWRDGALFVSSRASYEMVQKAASCGVEILFAVSAPTALAIETAQKCRLTLAAFSRSGRTNVYTFPERLTGFQ